MVFRIFLWFIIYSFAGWFYESVLCSITGKKLVNRGFLNGPVCPIYGCGAVTIILIFENYSESLLSLFLASAVVTCVIEYITSYLMEKLFHARWWDYSDKMFNINGRICMGGFIVFGAFSVILVKWFHPFVDGLIDKYITQNEIIISASILLVIIASDTIITVLHIIKMNDRLAEIQKAYDEFKEYIKEQKAEYELQVKERFENSKFYSERIDSLLKLRRLQDRRIWSAFPRMTSIKGRDALEKMKEIIEEKKQKISQDRKK